MPRSNSSVPHALRRHSINSPNQRVPKPRGSMRPIERSYEQWPFLVCLVVNLSGVFRMGPKAEIECAMLLLQAIGNKTRRRIMGVFLTNSSPLKDNICTTPSSLRIHPRATDCSVIISKHSRFNSELSSPSQRSHTSSLVAFQSEPLSNWTVTGERDEKQLYSIHSRAEILQINRILLPPQTKSVRTSLPSFPPGG